MELKINNEVIVTRKYVEGVFNMPDEPFFWQRWNYRQVCGIVPIYTEYNKEMYNKPEEIKRFNFIYFDDSKSLVEQYDVDTVIRLINRIKLAKKENKSISEILNDEENRVWFLLNEYNEHVVRKGGYVDITSQETALKHINGFIEKFKDRLFK